LNQPAAAADTYLRQADSSFRSSTFHKQACGALSSCACLADGLHPLATSVKPWLAGILYRDLQGNSAIQGRMDVTGDLSLGGKLSIGLVYRGNQEPETEPNCQPVWKDRDRTRFCLAHRLYQ
jgi:hypothetical protein